MAAGYQGFFSGGTAHHHHHCRPEAHLGSYLPCCASLLALARFSSAAWATCTLPSSPFQVFSTVFCKTKETAQAGHAGHCWHARRGANLTR